MMPACMGIQSYGLTHSLRKTAQDRVSQVLAQASCWGSSYAWGRFRGGAYCLPWKELLPRLLPLL